jgi:protein-disulfide isomerase
VVVRELPILSPQSADAAKMALAAAEQGKYGAFHRAMFAAGRPSPETIAAAAQTAGIDMDRARRTIADPRVEAELMRNVDFARQLGFNGTPSWIAGERLLSGAVGKAKLSEAIEAARRG